MKRDNKPSLFQHEFDREAAEREARRIISGYDAERKKEARTMFEERTGLLEAIKTELFPSIVSIRTINGIIGTGFFYYSQWLVSNAHVLPCPELLNGIQFIASSGEQVNLDIGQTYLRPFDRDDSPDAITLEAISRSDGSSQCIPSQFTFDEAHEASYLFYVDLNSSSSESSPVKFLKPLSKENTYPIIYECADGSIPQPGSSGSPIIEARVLTGHEPKWQFRVVGALYARCSSAWYNSNSSIKTTPASSDAKLVCAIPIKQEFSQALSIIMAGEHADRYGKMSAASLAIGDEKGKEDSEKFLVKKEESEEHSKDLLVKFELGHSSLRLDLPDGLEKLWYGDIVSVNKSLLIGEVLQRIFGKKLVKKRFASVPSLSESEVVDDFDAFIDFVNSSGVIRFNHGNNFRSSPGGHFRIDVAGSHKKGWQLDIQDNTGKLRYDKKSLSSVFAKVIIPKGMTSIDGGELAKLFRKSQEDKLAKDYSDLETLSFGK